MSRINKLFKPLRMEQVSGQTNIKVLIKNTLTSDNFTNFSIFHGSAGTGKSSVAEIVALALTCKNKTDHNPCLGCGVCKENYQCLINGKPSSHIVKVNMGLVSSKKDIADIIKEIFILQPMAGENFVYVLEEFHAVPAEYQIAFLEELEHIPPNVYVIICTTKVNKIINEIKSRAVMFEFKLPTFDECKLLIENLCRSKKVAEPSDEIIRMIIRYTKNCPRDIVKVMDLIFSAGNITEEQISKYLGFVKIDTYTNVLVTLTYDMSDFLVYINSLDMSISDILKGLKDFMMDVMLLLYGGKNIGFSQKNVKELKEVFKDFNELQFLNFLQSVGEVDPDEQLYGLVKVKRRLNELNEKEIYKESSRKAIKTVLRSEEKSQKVEEDESGGLKPLTSEYIMQLTKGSVKFKE